MKRFSRIEREYAARDRLAHYGLLYRQKILLYGPPSCGKTLGAERLAWNMGLPLLKVRFDAMVSSFLGETASNLRLVFEEASKNPTLPDAVPLILKIDPSSFELDGFKSYDIEVIADLEDGYIIGASADTQLSKLQQKIEKFIKEEYGGNKVAAIWEIVDGNCQLPKSLFPPNLLGDILSYYTFFS